MLGSSANRVDFPSCRRAIRFGEFTVLALLAGAILCGVPGETVTADDPALTKRYDAMLGAVYRARTTRTALTLVNDFEAANTLPETLRGRLKTQREKFVELERKSLVRLGNKWVTPKEFEAAAQKCAEEIEAAKESLKKGDGKGLIAHLEKAAKFNPNAIEPNFFLGMLFSIRGNCNPTLAEKYFQKVAVLNPDYVPVLNNLALTEVKQGKFDEAYTHWKQVAEINPKSPELLQNLGRLIREGASGRLAILDKRLKLFGELAENVGKRADIDDPNYGLGQGWLYSPLVKAMGEELAPIGDQPEPNKDVQLARNGDGANLVKGQRLIPTCSGTGFAIAPTLIVTNRHVVDDDTLGVAAAVTVQAFSGRLSQQLSGRVVALCENTDLALIEVPDGDAKPIPLSPRPIERGVEAGIFGFPQGLELGATLKLTRGLVTALPTSKFDGKFMLDAVANPGNSGGPVCDTRGQVIGVLTAILVGRGGGYSLAIPGADVLQFAGPLTPGLNLGPPDAAEASWKDIDSAVSDSVYYIDVLHRASSLRLVESLPPKMTRPKSELEDVSCCACNGNTFRRCTFPGCAAGGILDTILESRTLALDPNTSVNVPSASVTKRRCENCDGKGYVRCAACRGTGQGVDIR
jgi:Flp pilus assembly protein TadD